MSQVAPWETWEWPVPPGTTSTSLAETVERTTADLLASIAPLSEEFLDTPGTFDRWSGRDVGLHAVNCCLYPKADDLSPWRAAGLRAQR